MVTVNKRNILKTKRTANSAKQEKKPNATIDALTAGVSNKPLTKEELNEKL